MSGTIQVARRGVAQPGRAPSSGGGSRWFESSRPDHSHLAVSFYLLACSRFLTVLPCRLMLYARHDRGHMQNPGSNAPVCTQTFGSQKAQFLFGPLELLT